MRTGGAISIGYYSGVFSIFGDALRSDLFELPLCFLFFSYCCLESNSAYFFFCYSWILTFSFSLYISNFFYYSAFFILSASASFSYYFFLCSSRTAWVFCCSSLFFLLIYSAYFLFRSFSAKYSYYLFLLYSFSCSSFLSAYLIASASLSILSCSYFLLF